MVDLVTFIRHGWKIVSWKLEEGGVVAVRMYHRRMRADGLWRI